MMKRNPDIQAPEWQPPAWNAESTAVSLDALRLFAEKNAQAAIDWYYRNKSAKAMGSRFLRAFTIVATSLGGLIPIAVTTGLFDRPGATAVEMQLHHAHINQIGYVCIGLAALAVAFDRFFGISTAWMRYIATAMSLETALVQFRIDWAKLTSSLGERMPSGAELEILIKKISDFILTVRTLVENETKQWVSEFQTNLSDLEKETKTALEAARSSAKTDEKEVESLRDALRPGAIELTVENVTDTDAGYTAELDGKIAKSDVTTKVCGIRGVAPGLHEIEVKASMGGAVARALQVISVSANEIVKVSLVLAKVKAA